MFAVSTVVMYSLDLLQEDCKEEDPMDPSRQAATMPTFNESDLDTYVAFPFQTPQFYNHVQQIFVLINLIQKFHLCCLISRVCL